MGFCWRGGAGLCVSHGVLCGPPRYMTQQGAVTATLPPQEHLSVPLGHLKPMAKRRRQLWYHRVLETCGSARGPVWRLSRPLGSMTVGRNGIAAGGENYARA